MRSIIFMAAMAALTTTADAQQGQDHAAHHTEGASAPAATPKKVSQEAKAPGAKARMAAPTASGAARGMDAAQMKQMHDEMHKPGGMHDQMHGQMHGKDGKMAGSPMAMPPASAASR